MYFMSIWCTLQVRTYHFKILFVSKAILSSFVNLFLPYLQYINLYIFMFIYLLIC